MGFFDFFKKKKPEDQFRKIVRENFDEAVREVKPQLNGNDMFDGLMVQAALGTTYQALKNEPRLQVLGLACNWNPELIIEEEMAHALKKYLGIEKKNDSFGDPDFDIPAVEDPVGNMPEQASLSQSSETCNPEDFEMSDNGKILLKYKGTEKDVVIPSAVEEIAERAFCGCQIYSVIFPETLHNIGDNAFCSCASLSHVNLGECDKLTEIGDWAFSWCLNLKEPVILPRNLKKLGDNPFAHTSIAEVRSESPDFSVIDNCIIENSTRTLISAFFFNRKSADASHMILGKPVYLPVEISSYRIPSDVKIVGNSAFLGADNLKELIIPEWITGITGNPAPNGTSTRIQSTNPSFPVWNDMLLDKKNGVLLAYFGESNDVAIPEGVKSIDGSAFDHAVIKTLHIPDSLEEFDDDIMERMDEAPSLFDGPPCNPTKFSHLLPF